MKRCAKFITVATMMAALVLGTGFLASCSNSSSDDNAPAVTTPEWTDVGECKVATGNPLVSAGVAAGIKLEDTILVSVTLSKDVKGDAEKGEENGRANYHLTIPVQGLTTAWKFGSGYDFDNTDHKDWNIADGKLMLWMPVETPTHWITLENSETKKEIKIFIINNGNASDGEEVKKPGLIPLDGCKVETGDPLKVAGSAAAKEWGNVKLVSVTLNNDVEGDPQAGNANAQKNYHLTIPVQGLTTDWEFESGYDFDNTDHKDWNIADGKLMLWMPVENGQHNIILKTSDGKKRIAIFVATNGGKQ